MLTSTLRQGLVRQGARAWPGRGRVVGVSVRVHGRGVASHVPKDEEDQPAPPPRPPRRGWASTVGSYAARAATAVYGGVRYAVAIKSHTERLLTRTGLVKDADAAAYIGTTASITVWTAVALTAAGPTMPRPKCS
jgi:hypothetical protein